MFNKVKTIVSGIVFGLAGILLTVTVVNAQVAGDSDAFTDGPSAFCHVTDGVFTDCEINNGVEEWSDITPSFFDVFADVPGPESALYVDQADKDPNRSIPNGSGIDTLMLMYDEMLRTTPLGASETVHVHFMTVDNGEIVHYDVWIGTGGIQKVEIDGVLQDPMPSGLTGMAGYGTSPTSPTTPHVMAELQIGLEAAGFTSEECCYSPDPAWWGSSVPGEPQECREDRDCDGILDSQDPCPGTPGVDCPPPPEPCEGDFDCDGVPDSLDQCPREPGRLIVVDNQNDGHNDLGCPLSQQKPGEEEETTAGIFTANPDGSTTVDPEPLLPVGDEPPQAACIESVNPHGKTIPPAGRTTLPGPRGGQNDDGYYILKAEDQNGLPLPIEILSLSLAGPFGPYPSGTTVKITEAPGVTPKVIKIGSPNGKAGAVTDHIILDSDALLVATDADGDRIAFRCLVPPPPK